MVKPEIQKKNLWQVPMARRQRSGASWCFLAIFITGLCSTSSHLSNLFSFVLTRSTPACRTRLGATSVAQTEVEKVSEKTSEEISVESENSEISSESTWRPVLRRLLLARRQAVRQAALKDLAEVYDEVSGEIFAEVETWQRWFYWKRQYVSFKKEASIMFFQRFSKCLVSSLIYISIFSMI